MGLVLLLILHLILPVWFSTKVLLPLYNPKITNKTLHDAIHPLFSKQRLIYKKKISGTVLH